ncbi:MAG: NEW3 domain-containing protein [Dehalococcoidia bacterium]|nr:NEW3 domain-containing protein [Dehalococcoidia bacterium]
MLVRRALTITGLFVLVSMLGLLPGFARVPAKALADPSDFEMAMDYPSVVAQPGKTVSLNLRLMNRGTVSHQVNLSVTKSPDGWTSIIKQGAYEVRSAFLGPQENKLLTFEATPPASAKAADYSFVIKADSADGVSQIVTVSIGISDKVVSGTKLTSQYPVLTGPTGNKFEFKVDVNNGTGADQAYNLSASGPQGWDITFQPAYESTQISSIRVKEGETSSVNIQVQSPKTAKAGEYPVDLLISAGSEKVTGSFKVALTGTSEMTLTTDSGQLNLDATAGSQAAMSVLIINSGSADLKGISLSSSKPAGWDVSFEPKTVDLAAGANKEVNVYVKPDDKSIAGDYLVTVNASTPQVNKSLEIRVTVETPTVWGWVGLAIVLIVLGGLYGVFKTFSRR